jgi:hypothetical protein
MPSWDSQEAVVHLICAIHIYTLPAQSGKAALEDMPPFDPMQIKRLTAYFFRRTKPS